MPANKYALLRYRVLHRCISNKYKPYPSKEDLRRACEEALYGSDGERISVSTIEKDLHAMRNETELGWFAPIAYSKRDKGYFYEEDFNLDDLPLNEEDLESIRFAASTLYQFKDIGMFKQFGAAIDKIFGRLNIAPDVEDEAIQKYVQFETVPQVKGTEYLGDLLAAIKERLQVQIQYESFARKAATEYEIHPYLLKEYRNRWYVIGYYPKRDRVITFGLDRITGVQVSQAGFEVRDDFDPDRFFKYSIGITEGGAVPEKVVLSFSSSEGNYVRSQPLHQSQEVIVDNETEFCVSLHVMVTYELISAILSYGSGVRVVEPASLQQEISNRLAAAMEAYK